LDSSLCCAEEAINRGGRQPAAPHLPAPWWTVWCTC